MSPIAHMVQQMQQAATRPARRATSARITPELRRDVLAALQQGKTVREIRETFGISHKSLVKIRDAEP
ncbi:hypothetical protein [Microvirga sp. 17 mud 1-3]|uniref:hypothetical protein n=1 Tax=Microvirga sp. 17 mud 1-3 TaxID=2082949 RepID=UPI000D6BD683|nr:hypothetical protein [Microvirga sp. 17 mud 1-3]AWM87361.1 hypothetical protein C4E04_11865 [Microvirga sp. 17 mud 1-3]